MSDAEQRGWGPGWPNCNPGAIVPLRRANGVFLPCRGEIVPLVAWLCDETERRGYGLVNGWCWGYECRQIRQTGIPSNHSWGLAVDLNAPNNPATNDGQVHTDMPGWMVDLWVSHGFRWGGTYSGSFRDSMHYEFMGTPGDAARITADIGRGTAPAPPPAPPQTLQHTLAPGDGDHYMVQVLQVLLIGYAQKYNAPDVHPGNPDGDFGPKTAAAVGAFKHRFNDFNHAFHQRLTFPDWSPFVGPVTLGALRWADAA